MSSVEIRLAPVVNRRRQKISNRDAKLRGLNEIFPDERKKPDIEKDPAYQAMRREILAERRQLSGMQNYEKGMLREANGK